MIRQRIKKFVRPLWAGETAGAKNPFAGYIEALTAYSAASPRALEHLQRLALDVERRGIPGDVVECGVYKGGSAAAVAAVFRAGERNLWLYDSFEGLPAPTEIDGMDAGSYQGECAAGVEWVQAALGQVDFAPERTHIRKGWFDATFTEPLPKQVALLHVDCDWYESVLLTLETFYDRVAPGGIIILDDFGHWEGTREAFYDFACKRNLKPLLERHGYTQAFWVKERAHNRENVGDFHRD